ncbi:transmembrane channel-like protein 7 [Macrosteles quadrilineatus]|uniref:transmembrane channel-like protein 7 n=1 Tax=Macrosteles quadrilineatus TaxID=74068 RepID=UPI0023E2A697|nr:transmembrane channel-like protein 7 [Macrosteles quadrilineatus]
MSGGERKKRSSRGTGWEEAGGEFYQESYPGGDADLEVLQRDPHRIATLLPSKQNRAATSKRHNAHDMRCTTKRRTSTRSMYQTTTQARQGTTQTEVQVSIMPDLSENLSNEERTWEEMMLIKAMPVSMAQKKELKAKLQSADTFRLQGLKQFKWQRRKMWEQFKIKWKETYSKLELWKYSLKKIEGNFGTGVVAFFLFVKWLMFLNLTITLMIFTFIFLPSVLMEVPKPSPCDSNNVTVVECCAEHYVRNQSEKIGSLLEFVQGTGWMENTHLFYGMYPSIVFSGDFRYNLALAYISTAVGYFLLSFFAIMKSAAHGFKERLIENEGQFYHYCNMVFAGWDFCIHNQQSASIKHKALYNEMKASLEAERREEEKRNRSKDERIKLLMIRTIVNLTVLLILILAGIVIYVTFQISITTKRMHRIQTLLVEFAPSLCIVSLNLVVPVVFNYLVTFEHYSPIFVIRFTLFRTILLRLSSLSVLFASIYGLIKCNVHPEQCTSSECNTPPCWESYVGQQLYKLLILDHVSSIVVTLFVNFPRMLIGKHIHCRLARWLGNQEFDLPKHVLDVVYCQTLCWFGSFYAPLLPAIATVLFLSTFYIKKFTCLVNCSPSTTIYRASRSNSMFMSVLLVSFTVAVIPWAYTVAEIVPSKSCGPFKGMPTAWSVMEHTFSNLPGWIKSLADFCTTAGFAIPAFVILTLSLYYYYAVAAANKHMVIVLKKQLVLEGHDKQFLLNRLSAFIKQQQERHKAIRSIEPPN